MKIIWFNKSCKDGIFTISYSTAIRCKAADMHLTNVEQLPIFVLLAFDWVWLQKMKISNSVGRQTSKLMKTRLLRLPWKWKGDQFWVPKDTSHLQTDLITSSLMILSESFKLETHRKVNENESRYNPQTLQTSSVWGHRYIS